MVKIMGREAGKIYLRCSTKGDAHRWMQENFPSQKDSRKSILIEPFVLLGVKP